MSHLGEDAEAFFQKGDEGTYDGGPRSLVPATRETLPELEELTTEVTPELLERRDRLQRIVTTVVGVLGAGVLVLLPFRLVKNTAPEPVLQAPARAQESAPAIVPPQASPAVVREDAPAAHTTEPVAAAVAQPRVSAPPPVTQHRVVPSKSTVGSGRAVPTRAATARATSPTRPVRASVAPNNPSSHTAGSRRAVAGHAPPTANFPD